MNAPAVHRGDGSGREMMPGKNTTSDMFPDTLPASPVPTLLKSAIVRAAMAGWLHPERASWLLRRLHLVEA